MQNLFEKFEELEVKTTDRIPVEDVEFCENQQNLYDQAIGFLQGCLQKTKEIYNTYEDDEHKKDGYIDKHYDINHFEKRIENVQQAFTSKIKYYFTGKYKITINDLKTSEDKLHYSQIVEQIIDQLGGMSFGEKAVKEMKDALKESCRRGYSNEIKVLIKNKKVVLNSFIWVTKCSIFKRYEIGYNNRDTLVNLFKALTHYETGRISITNYYERILDDASSYRESVFEKYDLSYNKIQAIHIYKNGKTEVEFESSDQAKRFAKEYCGYVEEEGMVA